MRKIALALAAMAMLLFQPVGTASAATAGFFNYVINNQGQATLVISDTSTGIKYLFRSTAGYCGVHGSSYRAVYSLMNVNYTRGLPIVWYIANDCGNTQRLCFVNIFDRQACTTFLFLSRG